MQLIILLDIIRYKIDILSRNIVSLHSMRTGAQLAETERTSWVMKGENFPMDTIPDELVRGCSGVHFWTVSIEKVQWSYNNSILSFLWKRTFWGPLSPKKRFYKMYVRIFFVLPHLALELHNLFWQNFNQTCILDNQYYVRERIF